MTRHPPVEILGNLWLFLMTVRHTHNQRLGKVVLESDGVDLKYLYWLS